METDNISEEQVEDMETIEENVNESYDSYDELAAGGREEPPKKGRGRPKGAKNKTKTPPEEEEPPKAVKKKPKPPDEEEEPPLKVVMKKPKPPEIEEEPQPPPPPPKPKSKPKPKKTNFTLDVEFDEPSQKKQTPIRMKRPVAARSLMDVVAEAAHQHGARERDRRRNFYESFLPM